MEKTISREASSIVGIKVPQIVDAVLDGIRTIDADNDWDGISAAIQVDRHYPGKDIKINGEKNPDSHSLTLVLDKHTVGNGWAIDHHPYQGGKLPRKPLAFSTDGSVPASSLVYRILPVRDDTDLLLAATAEITEGLAEVGLSSGALAELLRKYPGYTAQSSRPNQFMDQREAFAIADILAMLPNIDVEYSFELGRGMSIGNVRSCDDLLGMLRPDVRQKIEEYIDFISKPAGEYFKTVQFDGNVAAIADGGRLAFPQPALAKALREAPGNYILLVGDRISVRTNEAPFMEAVIARLGERVKSYGGRAGWYGITLNKNMDYSELLLLLDNLDY